MHKRIRAKTSSLNENSRIRKITLNPINQHLKYLNARQIADEANTWQFFFVAKNKKGTNG